MTGISKNLLRFSSLLVAVAMFLGLAVAGCSDDEDRDKGSFGPVADGTVVFNMITDAVAKSSAAVDMYSISAFDESGDYVLGHSFVSPESGMTGSAFYTESGNQRTCTWKIDGIEELAISQFRIDYYEGQNLLGSAFIVENAPLTAAGKIYTEDAAQDGFSVVEVGELQDSLQIFVGSEEPVTELEAGQSAPVSALFTRSVGKKLFRQNAEVELEETEAATLEEDSVGQVLVANEVTEDSVVILTSEVEGAYAAYEVVIVPATSKAEIVFSNDDVETMTEEQEIASLEVPASTASATPAVTYFRVWEKVAAEEEGAEPTYTEVDVDTTDYVVAIAEGDPTGSTVLAEDGFAVQSGETVGETSVVVTRVGEEEPAATLTVNVVTAPPTVEVVFSRGDVEEMSVDSEASALPVGVMHSPSGSPIYDTTTFKVWEKVTAAEEGAEPTYTEITTESTDYTVAIAADDVTGSVLLTDDGFAVQGGNLADTTSIEVTRDGEEEPVASLSVQVMNATESILFAADGVTAEQLLSGDALPIANLYCACDDSATFTVWKATSYSGFDGVKYMEISRSNSNFTYSWETSLSGTVLSSMSWTVLAGTYSGNADLRVYSPGCDWISGNTLGVAITGAN